MASSENFNPLADRDSVLGSRFSVLSRIMPRGYDAVRIAAGLILLVAASLKAYQLSTEPVLATNLFESRWFLIGSVEFELFFGLWLLSGLLPSVTRKLAVACFAGFAAVSVYKAVSGNPSCGCFGRIELNPWYTACFDAVIVILLLCARPRETQRFVHVEILRFPMRPVSVFAGWLLVGAPIGIALGWYGGRSSSIAGETLRDGARLEVFEPTDWIGKPLPFTASISQGRDLLDGEWLVVFYHENCLKCQATIRTLASKRHVRDAISLVELPPYTGRKPVNSDPSNEMRLQKLDSNATWFIETPLILQLRNGLVVAVNPSLH